MLLNQKMKEAGIDIETGLRRFSGKEPLYRKYLLKFFDDTHYQEALAAISVKNYKGVLEAAHPLKGIAGTLGCMDLFSTCDQVVQAIRSNELDKVEELFLAVTAAYEKTSAAIRTLEE